MRIVSRTDGMTHGRTHRSTYRGGAHLKMDNYTYQNCCATGGGHISGDINLAYLLYLKGVAKKTWCFRFLEHSNYEQIIIVFVLFTVHVRLNLINNYDYALEIGNSYCECGSCFPISEKHFFLICKYIG